MARVAKSDPLQGYKYRISIPGLPNSVGFTKIGGLSQEVGVVTYDEGGYDYTHKLAGKVSTGELTCEKGMFANKQIESSFKKTLTNPDYRGTVTIELLDRYGKVGRKWSVAEAWISKWEAGEFDATSEDPVIETLTIQYEYFL